MPYEGTPSYEVGSGRSTHEMRIIASNEYRSYYRPEHESMVSVAARAKIACDKKPPPEPKSFAWFSWWHCFGCDKLMERNINWGTRGYTHDGICEVCELWITVDKADKDF